MGPVSTATARRPRRGRLAVETLAWLVGFYLVAYLTYALYLLVFTGDGTELPPTWRDPDVPVGAQVVSVDVGCGSGGCWRELVVEPRDGQTARELFAEMGLAAESDLGWRWYDPHSVYVRSSVGWNDTVRVSVGYTSID